MQYLHSGEWFFLLLFCAVFVPEMLYMPRLSHERMCNIRESAFERFASFVC